MDLTGQKQLGPLRVSSALRVRLKGMLRDGKVLEVEPGVFELSWWYKTDLDLKSRFKKEG